MCWQEGRMAICLWIKEETKSITFTKRIALGEGNKVEHIKV